MSEITNSIDLGRDPGAHGVPVGAIAGRGFRGWVFYDGRCGLCRAGARRLGGVAIRRGFRLAPLQRAWVRRRLRLDESELLREMRVMTAHGQVLGGAAAYVHLSRFVWWARPLVWVAEAPGGARLLDRVYAAIARNRHCISGICGLPGKPVPEGRRTGRLTRFWEV